MNRLAQASARNTRYAVLNIGPETVTCITIYNYQAESRHCYRRRSALPKHIILF